MKTFPVWSNKDANDSFNVEVEDSETVEDAAIKALNELGFSISAVPIEILPE